MVCNPLGIHPAPSRDTVICIHRSKISLFLGVSGAHSANTMKPPQLQHSGASMDLLWERPPCRLHSHQSKESRAVLGRHTGAQLIQSLKGKTLSHVIPAPGSPNPCTFRGTCCVSSLHHSIFLLLTKISSRENNEHLYDLEVRHTM